jgi:hypothetical protein
VFDSSMSDENDDSLPDSVLRLSEPDGGGLNINRMLGQPWQKSQPSYKHSPYGRQYISEISTSLKSTWAAVCGVERGIRKTDSEG